MSGLAFVLVLLAWTLWSAAASRGNLVASSRAARSSATAIKPPALELESQRTGSIVEIRGNTDCGASVMINGDRAPVIFDHCGFKHFLVVPEGKVLVTVTAMTPNGGVNTQQLNIE